MRRGLAFLYGGQRLLQRQAPVVMDPGVRRDDAVISSNAGLL